MPIVRQPWSGKLKAGEPGFDLGVAILKVDDAFLKRAEDAYDREEAAPKAAGSTARIFCASRGENAVYLILAGTRRGSSAGRWFQSRQRERKEPRLGRARCALLVERERSGPLVNIGRQFRPRLTHYFSHFFPG